MGWPEGSAPDNFKEQEITIKAVCRVHDSGRFALKYIDYDHCDIYFLLKRGSVSEFVLISRWALNSYAYTLIGCLLPLLDELDTLDADLICRVMRHLLSARQTVSMMVWTDSTQNSANPA